MSSTCTLVEPYQESEEELYASACDDVEARGSVEEQQKLLSAPAVRSHRILDDVRTAVTLPPPQEHYGAQSIAPKQRAGDATRLRIIISMMILTMKLTMLTESRHLMKH